MEADRTDSRLNYLYRKEWPSTLSSIHQCRIGRCGLLCNGGLLKSSPVISSVQIIERTKLYMEVSLWCFNLCYEKLLEHIEGINFLTESSSELIYVWSESILLRIALRKRDYLWLGYKDSFLVKKPPNRVNRVIFKCPYYQKNYVKKKLIIWMNCWRKGLSRYM